jgi:hypothetical protein
MPLECEQECDSGGRPVILSQHSGGEGEGVGPESNRNHPFCSTAFQAIRPTTAHKFGNISCWF